METGTRVKGQLRSGSASVIDDESLISFQQNQEVEQGLVLGPAPVRVSPAVLVPGFDLRVAELQGGCQLHAVLDAEVLLLLEAPLQPGQLLVAERRPRFAGLLGMEGGV